MRDLQDGFWIRWLGSLTPYTHATRQRKLFDCCLRICCRGNVFTESLPGNIPALWFNYSGFLTSWSQHNRCLSINLRTETDKVSETLCFLVLRISDDGPSLKTHSFWGYEVAAVMCCCEATNLRVLAVKPHTVILSKKETISRARNYV
jgi:hypothetical protein